mmetsp:Transcript_44944/g.103902  ORF Transcript_44944/g.103902 Transcript_44944/m.103902 type:complete len:422 (+) Transcript_44944:60-1325(+)
MAKDPLKVVVRLLPPEITEDELLATIHETHKKAMRWRSFEPGKRYKGEAKPSLNSRCYFQFESFERAEEFIKDYHGHQFVDAQGEQFRAVACFAPYQKVPRQKPQRDTRDGTIVDDPAYKEFVESLSEAAKAAYEAPPDPKQLLRPADYGDTPLLNYMKTRSKERRARFEKKEKRRWRDSGLEFIAEEPKKAKWHCAECGISKHLEEDPDDRGTFYCTQCWESWENQQAPVQKVKKKKKKSKEAEQEEVLVEDSTSKRKKKKKDRDREAGEEPSNSAEWRKEDEAERRLRKKKDKEKEWEKEDPVEDAEEGGRSNRWRVKKSEARHESSEHGWQAKGGQKGSHQDDWWEEERTRKRLDHKVDKKPEPLAAEEGRGVRWRAKGSSSARMAEDGTGEHDEKPRRSRKERKGEGTDSGYWRPKS